MRCASARAVGRARRSCSTASTTSTPLQLDAIETLGGSSTRAVTVSLAYEPGRVGFAGRAGDLPGARAAGRASTARCRARAEHYAPHARARRSATSSARCSSPAPRASSRARPCACSRAAASAPSSSSSRARSRAARPRAWPPRRSPCSCARPAPRSELLEEVFADAGIPFTLQRRRPFADTAIGRALIGLLRCVPRRAASPPASSATCWPGCARRACWSVPALADRLERARAAAGRSSAERREGAVGGAPLAPGGDRPAARGPAARPGGAARSRVARALLAVLRAPPRRRAERARRGRARRGRARSRPVRGRSASCASSRGWHPSSRPRRRAELAERARAGIELLSGERPAPGAVAVLDPLALRARRVRALFVCGLQEGVVPGAAPARSRCSPRRSAAARRALRAARSASQQDLLAAERYLLYAAVSRPEEQLVLSWHTADDDGAADAALAVRRRRLRPVRARSLLASAARRRAGRGRTGVAGLRRRTARSAGGALRTRRCATSACSPSCARAPWSASSLERWIGCPVGWFVERLLRPDALTPTPSRSRAAALAPRGAEGHAWRALRRETGSARLTPASLARARELLARRAGRARGRAIRCRSRPSACRGRAGGCRPTSSATSSMPPSSESPLEPTRAGARVRLRARATNAASRASCRPSSSAGG